MSINVAELTPKFLLSLSKHDCFLNLFSIKFRELFKERYYLETKRQYKDNPFHGEFIIEMLGEDRFNKFNTESKGNIKSGIVNKWKSDILYVLLLSYPYKSVPIDKLNKENKIIERVKFIETKIITCQCCSKIDQLIELRDELTELYISIGGKQIQINNALDSFKNISLCGSGNGSSSSDSILIKEKGDQYFNKGLFNDAIDEYEIAIEICKTESYNYEFGFSLLSILNLNKSFATFKSNMVNSNNDINSPIICSFYKSIKEIVEISEFSTKLTPSWSKAWAKRAYYISKVGSTCFIMFAIKFIDVALLLDPKNNEYKKLKQQFIKQFNSKSDFLNIFYGPHQKVGRDSLNIKDGFHLIAANYIKENKFEIPLNIKKEFSAIHTSLFKFKDSNLQSIQYFRDALNFNNDGKFELAFKSFCFSILAGDPSGNDNAFIIHSAYYELGLMYVYGNSFIKVDYRIAISLFYQSSIGIGCSGDVKFIEKPTIKDLRGRIGSMYQLSKLFYNSYETLDFYRSAETTLYWLRRIGSIDDSCGGDDATKTNVNTDIYGIKSHIDANEKIYIGKALYNLGSILLVSNPSELSGLDGIALFEWKIEDAFNLLSKGYLQYNSVDCYHSIENSWPDIAIQLKSNNQHIHHRDCFCITGKNIFETENQEFKKIQLDYVKIK